MKKIIALLTFGVLVPFSVVVAQEAGGSESSIEVRDAGAINVAEAPDLDRAAHIVLWTDQNGNISSTNAVATSADLAVVSARVVLAESIQEANEEGYSAATNLLSTVAANLANVPIVFTSVELTSFVAATVFDEATSKLRIFDYQVTDETDTRLNMTCVKTVIDYGFTSDIQGITPVIQYVETLDGETPVDEWDALNSALVDGPIAIENEPITTKDGTTYSNFYRLYVWLPQSRISGFCRVVVTSSAADPSGNTIDTVGVTDGFTGTYTYGSNVLNIRGGYIMATGTGPVSE